MKPRLLTFGTLAIITIFIVLIRLSQSETPKQTPSKSQNEPKKHISSQTSNISSSQSSPDELAELLESLGDTRSLTQEVIDSYLESQNRSSESLLAAFIATSNLTDLKEALEKDPKNPLLLFHAVSSNDASFEERLNWSQTLIEQQPTNALASAIHASLLYQSGNKDAALSLLEESVNLTHWEDFYLNSAATSQSLLEHSGLTKTASKLTSLMGVSFENQITLNKTLREIHRNLHQHSPQQQENLRNLTAQIGQRFRDRGENGVLLNSILGQVLQEASLRNLPDDAPSPFHNLTVVEARERLAQQKEQLNQVATQNPLFDPHDEGSGLKIPPGLTQDILINYIDRIALTGELNATNWLNQQLGRSHP